MASVKPTLINKRGTTLATVLYRVTGVSTSDQIDLSDTGNPSTDSPEFSKVLAAVAVSPTENSAPAMTINANGVTVEFSAGAFTANASLYVQVVGWAIRS